MDFTYEYGVMNQLDVLIIIDLERNERWTPYKHNAELAAVRNQRIANDVGARDSRYRVVKRPVMKGNWRDA
jgi:hypothetical protein